jgi:hypothetical protein
VCAVLLAGRFFCSRVAMSSSSSDDELMMSKGFFIYAILWEARAVFKLYFCTATATHYIQSALAECCVCRVLKLP